MLVRNIITAFALAGLATAMPTEEFEDEIEARTSSGCPLGHSFCCKSAIKPLNLWFIKAAGQGCDPAGDSSCGSKKTYLCCEGGQIKDGKNVICT